MIFIFTELSKFYPLYPPLVKVIRPRLQRSMMPRVIYWDPTRNMKTVLMDLKKFLAAQARLDLISERNDHDNYYIDIDQEHILMIDGRASGN